MKNYILSYKYVWNDFANTYLEYFKKNNTCASRHILIINMIYTINKLLHPFIPHTTEEIGEIMKRKYDRILKYICPINRTISKEIYPDEYSVDHM